MRKQKKPQEYASGTFSNMLELLQMTSSHHQFILLAIGFV